LRANPTQPIMAYHILAWIVAVLQGGAEVIEKARRWSSSSPHFTGREMMGTLAVGMQKD